MKTFLLPFRWLYSWVYIRKRFTGISLNISSLNLPRQLNQILKLIMITDIMNMKWTAEIQILNERYDPRIVNCNLNDCKLIRRIFRDFNGIRDHGLCVSGAVLYQLSYEEPYIGSIIFISLFSTPGIKATSSLVFSTNEELFSFLNVPCRKLLKSSFRVFVKFVHNFLHFWAYFHRWTI